jgi:predicted DNA-binding transcriptional regulator YafY
MKKGKPSKKYSQAGRVHDVIRLIEARHGITVDELAEETGVDRRTVYRDLAAIQEAGYPLISDRDGVRKLYRFLTRFKDIPPITFTLQELMALSLFRSQLDFLKGTAFRDDMEAIFRKVNSVLPPRYAAHMERITRVSVPLLHGIRDYGKVAEQLSVLRDALLYQYRVAITYDAGGKGKQALYDVDPYTLVFYKGGIYLLGFARNRGALRTFAAERIVAVEKKEERFELPEEFQPESHFGSAFGIVDDEVLPIRIRFSAAVAPAIRERVWHPTQRVEEEPDGRVVLSFEAGGRMEIVSWILSYGRHAELLEPAELREEMVRQVAEMAAAYGAPN